VSDTQELAHTPTELQTVPGHLIRRCQQIAVAIFLDVFRELGLKPVHFAALSMVQRHPGIDQRRLVNLIAVDRTTIGAILRNLETKCLLRRQTPRNNLRVKQIFLLPKGEAVLAAAGPLIDDVQARIMGPLDPHEQDVFLTLLRKLVEGNNEFSRVPIRVPEEA
jgi:DNA-binding MarR family transcriptional regulator